MVVLKRLTDELLNPTHEEMFTRGIHRAAWHLAIYRERDSLTRSSTTPAR